MNQIFDPPPLNRENLWRTISSTTTVAVVVFGLWLLISQYHVVLIVFLAIFLSTALRPLWSRFSKFGISRTVAVYLVYGFLGGGLIIFFMLALPQVTRQNQVILQSTSSAYDDLRSGLITAENPLLHQIGRAIPDSLLSFSEIPEFEPAAAVDTETEEEPPTVSPTMWVVLTTTLRSVLYSIVVLALSFYWSLDGQRFIQLLLLLVPYDHRDKARSVIGEIQNKVGAFVIGQIILCSFIFVLSLLLYLAIGLPYPFLLALVAGIFEVVPNIGPLLGAVPALLVAVTHDPIMAVWVLLGSAAIQGVENYFLVPRVMQKTVGVRPFITVLAIVIFGALFGLVGAIVAIPLAVILEIILNRLFSEDNRDHDGVADRSQASVLRYQARQLVQDVRKQIRQKQVVASATSDQVEDSLEAIAADLDSFLSKYSNGQEGETAL